MTSTVYAMTIHDTLTIVYIHLHKIYTSITTNNDNNHPIYNQQEPPPLITEVDLTICVASHRQFGMTANTFFNDFSNMTQGRSILSLQHKERYIKNISLVRSCDTV